MRVLILLFILLPLTAKADGISFRNPRAGETGPLSEVTANFPSVRIERYLANDLVVVVRATGIPSAPFQRFVVRGKLPPGWAYLRHKVSDRGPIRIPGVRMPIPVMEWAETLDELSDDARKELLDRAWSQLCRAITRDDALAVMGDNYQVVTKDSDGFATEEWYRWDLKAWGVANIYVEASETGPASTVRNPWK